VADDTDSHPGIEALEAYVEGRLSPEERAEIDRLAEQSSIVAEDLADLRAVRAHLPVAVGRTNVQWGRVAAGLGIAASLVLAVWLFPSRPAEAPGQTTPVAVSSLTAAEQARVDAAVSAGRIELPASVSALIRPQGTLLGAQGTPTRFGPLGPVGTAVRSTRPTFSWGDAGADAYSVSVFDANFKEVARSERVQGTSWSPEADLPRGVPLVWQVTAHRGAVSETEPKPPQPEARFSVIDAATLARVEEQAARLADNPLALGVLYAEAGLIADARAELLRAAEIPASADAARRLLRSLDQPQAAR
jgi:hypothetical protein